MISDYVGLGAAGPHAYLVGEAAARNVLDATRAARQFSRLRLDRRTVVWGHSQGGHGAIWAGGIGPRYAPELDILGVAALAPATDLDQLATGVKNTTFGRIVSAYLADSWAAYYPQLDMNRLVDRRYRRTVSRIGQRCFGGRDALAAAAITSQLFGPSFPPPPCRGRSPTCYGPTAPMSRCGRRCWSPRATPTHSCSRPCSASGWPPAAPPASSSTFAAILGLEHLSLVTADSPLTPALVAWAQARLAGNPATPHAPPAEPPPDSTAEPLLHRAWIQV